MTFLEFCVTELLGQPQNRNAATGVADWDSCPRCHGPGFHSLPPKPDRKDRCKCSSCKFLADTHDVLQVINPSWTYGKRIGWVDEQQRRFNSPRAFIERRQAQRQQRNGKDPSINPRKQTRNAAPTIDCTKAEMAEGLARLNVELLQTKADLNMARFALNPYSVEWPTDDELRDHIARVLKSDIKINKGGNSLLRKSKGKGMQLNMA